jgi:hypothetical protein
MSQQEAMDEKLKKFIDDLESIRDEHPDCPSSELIARHLADELPAEESLTIEFHLANCARCGELMERMQRKGPSPLFDGAFRRGLNEDRDRLAEHLGLKKKRRGFLAWFFDLRTPLYVPAGAAALLLLALFFTFSPPGGPAVTIHGSGTRLQIQQSTIRGEETGKVRREVSPGLVLLTFGLDDYSLDPGDPVECVVIAPDGAETGRTIPLAENYTVRPTLSLTTPGRYTVRFVGKDGTMPLGEFTLDVVKPAP